MRARAFVRPCFAAALALLSACSLVNDPADHQALSPVPVEEICTEFATVVCEAHLACCSTATVAFQDCYSSWLSGCTNQIGSLAIDPRTGYDPRVAAEVLAEGRAFADACDTGVMAWIEARSGFSRVLTGTVGGGGDCSPLTDLASHFSCMDLQQACLAAGFNGAACQDRHPVGDDCAGNYDCAEGLYCKGDGFLVAGMCAERLAENQPCEDNSSCQSLVCDGDTKLCVIPTVDSVYCALGPP